MKDKRWWLGILVVLFGVLLLLNNLMLISFKVSELWPLILVFFGVMIICEHGNGSNRIFGIILGAVGLFLLGRNLGFIPEYLSLWKIIWPVVLILLGLKFLGIYGGKFEGRSAFHGLGSGNIAFMGSIERNNGSWDLKSDGYLAFMGGIELDLRYANFIEDEIKLSLTSFMAGIEVLVPSDLIVICNGTAFLGGIELLGKPSGGIMANLQVQQGEVVQGKKILRLDALVFLGGIEVKLVPTMTTSI